MATLIRSGARIHQAGCNGCIGMGQAPATDKISLRTVPRNFPGRSGTPEDQVCLVSPETAAASALEGVITDPRTLETEYPEVEEPEDPVILTDHLEEPPPEREASEVKLQKGPNIESLPEFDALPREMELPVLLKVDDDISTDEIMPAGAKVLPYRSNIPKISEFCFGTVDDSYPERAEEHKEYGGHVIVGGTNYGQGSSREHAALAPRYLGLRAVVARSFARIHWQNLVNFGVLPLEFADEDGYGAIEQGDTLRLENIHQALEGDGDLVLRNASDDTEIAVEHSLSRRQAEVLLAGGLINWVRERKTA